MTARGDEMKERTLQFSFRVGHLVHHLGRDNTLSEVYGRQLLRCASSVGLTIGLPVVPNLPEIF